MSWGREVEKIRWGQKKPCGFDLGRRGKPCQIIDVADHPHGIDRAVSGLFYDNLWAAHRAVCHDMSAYVDASLFRGAHSVPLQVMPYDACHFSIRDNCLYTRCVCRTVGIGRRAWIDHSAVCAEHKSDDAQFILIDWDEIGVGILVGGTYISGADIRNVECDAVRFRRECLESLLGQRPVDAHCIILAESYVIERETSGHWGHFSKHLSVRLSQFGFSLGRPSGIVVALQPWRILQTVANEQITYVIRRVVIFDWSDGGSGFDSGFCIVGIFDITFDADVGKRFSSLGPENAQIAGVER